MGARFSAPVQTGPGAHPTSCTMGTGSFPGGKERPGRDTDPSPPSSGVGHERVELYLYSTYGPYGLYRASVPVQGCTLFLTCICLMAGGLLVKTWRQSVTRRDVRYVAKRDVRALHDVTSDMSHERQDFVTWLLHANAHPASRISQYEN